MTMVYILDSNILVHAVRESNLFLALDERLRLTNSLNQNIISSVTIGELYSLAVRNRWGLRKKDRLEMLLNEFNVFPISDHRSLHERYADIDAFSQSSHPTLRLRGSARKMSKNDLWIASTSAIFRGTLLTTDGDFNHLHNVFFKVEYIDPQLY